MEEISVLERTDIRKKAEVNNYVQGKDEHKKTGFNQSVINLISEGGMTFYRYLSSLGMAKESNLVVLSSKHHYYYDEHDLKNVRILVNLKKLNFIKHLDMFLNTLVRILPPETNFVGYFSDSNYSGSSRSGMNRMVRFVNRINNHFATRTDYLMNREDVTELLERNGFKTVDMREINGHVYFTSMNIRQPVN